MFEDADYMLTALETLIDVEKSEATNPSDLERELGTIRETEGGTAAVERSVRMAVRGAKACVGIPTVQRAALLGDSGGEGGDVGTLESLAALAQDKMQTDVEKAVVLRSASASGYVNVVRWLLLHGEVSSVIDGANVPHRTWARERKEARGRA